METTQFVPAPKIRVLTQRDYLLVSIIGISFALFSLPIIRNLNIPFLQINSATVTSLVIFFLIFANFSLAVAGFLSRKIPVILQVAKFSAIGAFNTFLDFGIVNLLMTLSEIFAGLWYTIFNGISFIVANTGSFFWNKHWTFTGQTGETVQKDMAQFFIVSIIGLGIKAGTASIIVNVVGPLGNISVERWANVGLIFGVLLALVWNFIGYKFWVFKK